MGETVGWTRRRSFPPRAHASFCLNKENRVGTAAPWPLPALLLLPVRGLARRRRLVARGVPLSFFSRRGLLGARLVGRLILTAQVAMDTMPAAVLLRAGVGRIAVGVVPFCLRHGRHRTLTPRAG